MTYKIDLNAAAIQNHVHIIIKRLTDDGTKKGNRKEQFTPWGTAMLAKLRNAAGAAPSERPDVWEVTLGACLDRFSAEDREKAELAIHTALTLFGLHQQGKYESLSWKGIRFGQAAKSIIAEDRSNEAGIRRRFSALVTSTEFTELSHHLRGLVQLMRAKPYGFDYPRFAGELYKYQQGAEFRDIVCTNWGRDFYAPNKHDAGTTEGDDSDE